MDKFLKKLEKLLGKSELDEETKKQILDLAEKEPDDEPTEEPKGEELPNPEPEGKEPVEPPSEPTPTEEPTPEEPVPPVEEPVVPQEQPQPAFDPTELLTKIDELSKANEGLVSRIDALENALKEANVLTDKNGAVGIDENKAPANNPIDDPMASVLDEINHRR